MPIHHRCKALLIAAVLAAGCAPLPMQVYGASADLGRPQFSSCAFNAHVPVGWTLELAGVAAAVRLAEHDGRPFLELRLDVPDGTVVALQGASVGVATLAPARVFNARFASASLVDNPIVNAFSPDPGLQRMQLPATARLVGGTVQAGRQVSGRHFWFATHLDIDGAQTVVVTLPGLWVNGALVSMPEIRFHRQSVVAVATINC